uniref:hypothetical protein n=1 Tax=Pontibacterium sp. TaxID=2036026 RepID=UPI0035665489
LSMPFVIGYMWWDGAISAEDFADMSDAAIYTAVAVGLFFAYHFITKPIHTLKDLLIGLPMDFIRHNYSLWLEFFGHNIKLSLPYHIEAMEKPARIEQGFSWRKLFSALWAGIVLLAWAIALVGIVWLATS